MHKRYPRRELQPLRITARLQCGVVADAALPIDGVLYSVAMRETYGEQTLTFPGSETPHPGAVAGVSLPLARVDEHTPRWYYAASWAQWSRPIAHGSDHWNCRIDTALSDLIDFGARRGSIDIGSSRYKAYHMPVFYRHALSVCWYVVGHAASIRALLRFATHLGKKTAQGWGTVLDWSIDQWDEDWSVRRGSRLMRAIPANDGLLHGYRPSYWLPKNQTLCEMPLGEEAEDAPM